MITKLIGQKIKERRETLNVSPKAVASELGITPRAYAYLEDGAVDIKASTLLILKEYLQLNISSLFEEENKQLYTLQNNLKQPENLSEIYNSKELLDKVSELYERIIILEKSKNIRPI